jgi:hypothetical protein
MSTDLLWGNFSNYFFLAQDENEKQIKISGTPPSYSLYNEISQVVYGYKTEVRRKFEGYQGILKSTDLFWSNLRYFFLLAWNENRKQIKNLATSPAYSLYNKLSQVVYGYQTGVTRQFEVYQGAPKIHGYILE